MNEIFTVKKDVSSEPETSFLAILSKNTEGYYMNKAISKNPKRVIIRLKIILTI